MADTKADNKVKTDIPQELIDQIKAELMDELKGKAAEVTSDAPGPTPEEIAKGDEEVEVYLFKDNNLYKDDLTVGVNGEIIKIKRGEKVMIKRKFKEVIDNSQYQDAHAADLNEELSDEFKEKSTALE
jgi:hypothetical protein